MKIKTKLTLSVGSLFVMIIILTLTGAFYIFSIKKDTANILKANYNTLEYSRNMLLALDKMAADNAQAVFEFESNLKKQEGNITELGEEKLTQSLQFNFDLLKRSGSDEALKRTIRQDIFEIMTLNMKAIRQKSDIANQTAETATFWIAITGTLCFLIAFNLLVNVPNNIANPIKELTASIKEIANKNYSQRVHFYNHNEYGEVAKSFNTMAEKLQEYANSNLYKLSFEKKRLETLINNMHDPIIGFDNDGKILFVNNEALKIMGLKSEDVVEKSASTLALTNDLLKSLIINDMESAKSHPLTIFADGKESYFEKETVTITITPTGEEQTLVIGNVIILRNITIFKELDFAKTNFIATVSHELKTPIAAIKFSLQLLEKEQTGVVNPEQKLLIESIKDDAGRLLKITGELLEMSQLETGKIQLDVRRTDARIIVSDAIDAVKTQADQRRIRIETSVEQSLPDIKADSEKTAWVLINFLTNAIRYSPEDSQIIINLKSGHNKVVFEVTDSGQGIDARYQPKVFDRYFRIPGSDKSGTGLGLAISKEFIEAQNGSIGVRSQLGLGSTFYFELDVIV